MLLGRGRRMMAALCGRRAFSSVCTHLTHEVQAGERVFVAPGATVMGDVHLDDDSSVFYGSVLRADINTIRIGKRSNIQDGTIIHLASDKGVNVGEDVTVGHRALLHACDIGDRVLVGMGAIIMDRAVIGSDSIVAAGSVVTLGKEFPPGSLIVGSPARVVRELTGEERAFVLESAAKYVKVQREHQKHMFDYEKLLELNEDGEPDMGKMLAFFKQQQEQDQNDEKK